MRLTKYITPRTRSRRSPSMWTKQTRQWRDSSGKNTSPTLVKVAGLRNHSWKKAFRHRSHPRIPSSGLGRLRRYSHYLPGRRKRPRQPLRRNLRIPVPAIHRTMQTSNRRSLEPPWITARAIRIRSWRDYETWASKTITETQRF